MASPFGQKKTSQGDFLTRLLYPNFLHYHFTL
jgi:hypothetical protein